MERKKLSAPGMYGLVRRQSQPIPDPRRTGSVQVSLPDAILSAMAMFAFKYPSLLQFDQAPSHPTIASNLKTLFGLSHLPCDTTMREILDPIPTQELQRLFLPLYREAQRGKVLEDFVYHQGAYLLSIDGTGFFSSPSVHCDHCLQKTHKHGDKTYYHQMLCGVLCHPGNKEVLPFSPEPIVRQDGDTKQDCERRASARLLQRIREEHPHLKLIVTEDGLSSNGPHLTLLSDLRMGYIVGCKPGDHTTLFDFIEGAEKLGEVQHFLRKEGTTEHHFRWMERVPLNDEHPDLLVNFLEYWEQKPKGTSQHFSWVTDLPLTKDTVEPVMRGGRARWKIENETFNTLKNLGYQFEHNFGHGYQHLSNNLAVLMMLVFLIDQLQQRSCTLFQAALLHCGRKLSLWEFMRTCLRLVRFASWAALFLTLSTDQLPRDPDSS